MNRESTKAHRASCPHRPAGRGGSFLRVRVVYSGETSICLLGLYWGYIGIMEKKMETTVVYWAYIGVSRFTFPTLPCATTPCPSRYFAPPYPTGSEEALKKPNFLEALVSSSQ